MQEIEVLKPFIEMMIGNMGVAAQVTSILFVVQSINKILQVVIPAIKSVVGLTPSKKDDELIEKIEGSKFVKYVKWFVDFLFRIKLK